MARQPIGWPPKRMVFGELVGATGAGEEVPGGQFTSVWSHRQLNLRTTIEEHSDFIAPSGLPLAKGMRWGRRGTWGYRGAQRVRVHDLVAQERRGGQSKT